MQELDFTGKRVLVVGGSSGIGNGIARAFLDHGAETYVWGTRPSSEDYDGVDGSDLSRLSYAKVDVRNRKEISQAPVPDGAIDVLVLSQGVVVYQRGEFESDGWGSVMSVNLDSLIACCNHFKHGLAQRGGSIVIISSISGRMANKGNPAYAASKAGAISLTASLGQAWAPEGIRVNGVAPGLVDTKLTKVTTENPARLERTIKSIPCARMGTPDDIAGAVLFLASPLASYVCGQTIVVDGGVTL